MVKFKCGTMPGSKLTKREGFDQTLVKNQPILFLQCSPQIAGLGRTATDAVVLQKDGGSPSSDPQMWWGGLPRWAWAHWRPASRMGKETRGKKTDRRPSSAVLAAARTAGASACILSVVARHRNGCAGRPSKILNASTIIPSCVFDGGMMCIGDWGCARCRLRDGCGQGVRQSVITSKDASNSTQPDAAAKYRVPSSMGSGYAGGG